MACFSPLRGFKPIEGGAILWAERKNTRPIELPCGHCIGCRIRRQREWTVRLMCEAKMHEHSMFVTLTYNNESKPIDNGLHYKDVQGFLHRLRKRITAKVRYFVCGEYGDASLRPHYHMCLFGFWPDDAYKSNSVYAINDLYKSRFVEEVWGKGFADFGQVTPQSAAYCAGYVLKKWNGPDHEGRYERIHEITGEVTTVEREFAHMSLKPGIGAKWLEKYHPDLFKTGHDAMRVDNGWLPIPKYFKTLYESIDDLDMEAFMVRMQEWADKEHNRWNSSSERLAIREEVATAKQSHYKQQRDPRNAI